MPRRSKKLPKYCFHRSSGHAYITLNYEQIFLGEYGSEESKQKYDEEIAAWLARGRLPRYESDAGDEVITVSAILAAYHEHALAYYVKHGQVTNEVNALRAAMRVLRRLHGPEPAAEFGPLKLKGLQQAMIELDWCRTHINKQISRVVRIFSWAESEELVPKSHTAALREVDHLKKGRCKARESAPIQPVPDLTIDLTLPYMPPIVADMVRLQRKIASRPEEVCWMRPCDIDTSQPVWEYRPWRHKMEHEDRPRVICIGPQAQEILKPYLMRDPGEYCFSPAEGERRRRAAEHQARTVPAGRGNRPGSNRVDDPQRSSGDYYTTASYRRAITRACELAFRMPVELRKRPRKETQAAKLERQEKAAAWRAKYCWAPNQIRHTAGTEIRGRFGLEASQVTLGHKKADVTQIYAERDLKKARKVARKMG